MSDPRNFCNRIIQCSFYALFFLVPLILTPWNYELFEFNKMMLVYLLTIIIVAGWLIKMIIEKKFIFRPTFWDIPLGLFLLFQFFSFLFSIDRHTSFWGYYSRFNGGLASVIAYALLYWAFVSNMDFDKTLRGFRYILISAVLVTTYGILEHFGIDAKYWVQDVKNRVFSTIGQPNWLAAWLTALAPLTWALVLRVKEQESGRVKKFLLFYSLTLLLYICLLYTKSRSGLIGFAIAYFLFWGLGLLSSSIEQATIVSRSVKDNLRRSVFKTFLLITLLLLITTAMIGTPWTPNISNLKHKILKTKSPLPSIVTTPTTEQPAFLISESGDIRRVVWKGAVDLWRHHPLLGTGPETFAYSYYWYRPREHNDLSEWDFLYNKAHNEYLNYLATTGIFGLGSYLLLIVAYIFWSINRIRNQESGIKEKNQNSLFIIHYSLFAGFTSILITNFFGFSVVPVSLLLFLFPAMAVTISNQQQTLGSQPVKKIAIKQWLVISSVLLLTSYFLIFTLKYWYADTQLASGLKSYKEDQPVIAFNELQRAVRIWDGEPFYHNELAAVAANLAIFAKEHDQATLSAQLTEMAINESDKSIKANPYNLTFWKNRSSFLIKLAEKVDEKYYQPALTSLLTASQLAPTEPKIPYMLGLLYGQLGQIETGTQALEKAVELKPNYDHARYYLALFYAKKKEIKKAKEQLTYILEKINPQYQPAIEKLKSLP